MRNHAWFQQGGQLQIIILTSYHGLVAFFGLFAIVAAMFMGLHPAVPIGIAIFLVGYGIWLFRKEREP